MQLITIKENVECQRLLLTCEISERSQWFPMRIFMNPGGVLTWSYCLQQSALAWHVVWLTVASQCFQVPRVANFPTSLSFYNCVTMDGNLASVHSACSMLLRMLLEQRWNLRHAVTTLDLMLRKIFEIWWFDKCHVEMDVMWFWR